MKRLYLILALIGLLVGGLFAQPYSPNDPDWRQGRHDYKKTGRAPWRCSAPASVSKQWDHTDPNDSYIFVTTADINGDGAAEIFYSGDDRGAFDGAPNVFLTHTGGVMCDNSFWADQAAGDCVIGTNGAVYCPLTETDEWGDVEGYFTKGNYSCGEVYRRSEGEYHSNLTIADVNGDGNPEIYRGVGSWAVSVNGNAGGYSENWSANMGADVGTPVLGDFDGDATMEVCFPLTNNTINCRTAINGAYEWTWSMPCAFGGIISGEYGPASWQTQAVMAEDVDRDGKDELIALGNSCVAVFKHGVGLLWTTSVSSNVAGAVGKLNGDPYPDIVVGNASWPSGTYTVLSGIDGSVITTFTESSEGCSAPTIADITGDGINDVLVACIQPVAWSASNGWSGRVWTGSGAAPYTITSDLVVSRKTNTSLMLVLGDASCVTNEWSCPVAVLGYDDGLSVGEKASTIVPYAVLSGKGYVEITGYIGYVGIYTPSGRFVKGGKINGYAKFELPSGVYIVRTDKGVKTVIVK